MKRIITLAVSLVMLVTLFAGCGDNTPAETSPTPSPSPTPTDTLSGNTEELLTQLIEKTNQQLPEETPLPGSFETEVTSETAESVLGITADDFTTYVESAFTSAAMISTIAFELTIVKCVDLEAAGELLPLITEGYDPWKWICVSPEQVYIVQSGTHILLVSATVSQGATIMSVFTQMTNGNVKPAEVLYVRGEETGAE